MSVDCVPTISRRDTLTSAHSIHFPLMLWLWLERHAQEQRPSTTASRLIVLLVEEYYEKCQKEQ